MFYFLRIFYITFLLFLSSWINGMQLTREQQKAINLADKAVEKADINLLKRNLPFIKVHYPDYGDKAVVSPWLKAVAKAREKIVELGSSTLHLGDKGRLKKRWGLARFYGERLLQLVGAVGIIKGTYDCSSTYFGRTFSFMGKRINGLLLPAVFTSICGLLLVGDFYFARKDNDRGTAISDN